MCHKGSDESAGKAKKKNEGAKRTDKHTSREVGVKASKDEKKPSVLVPKCSDTLLAEKKAAFIPSCSLHQKRLMLLGTLPICSHEA
jgi:hypothetical protein